ncbi:hypothetical protein Salat_1435300 [Sesamum alatum]|uniref:Uncharacterized protein n=1 Tax=Sesamum alatum TaxID=300844 RepID=A0AAE2CLJ8_9LAMI|nr:hypothetical protein Salat_1435300 [Sesamum alatum]
MQPTLPPSLSLEKTPPPQLLEKTPPPSLLERRPSPHFCFSFFFFNQNRVDAVDLGVGQRFSGGSRRGAALATADLVVSLESRMRHQDGLIADGELREKNGMQPRDDELLRWVRRGEGGGGAGF